MYNKIKSIKILILYILILVSKICNFIIVNMLYIFQSTEAAATSATVVAAAKTLVVLVALAALAALAARLLSPALLPSASLRPS